MDSFTFFRSAGA